MRYSMSYLEDHLTFLPYDARREARGLIRKWRDVKRLSQLEQLRVDKLIEQIESIRALRRR